MGLINNVRPSDFILSAIKSYRVIKGHVMI